MPPSATSRQRAGEVRGIRHPLLEEVPEPLRGLRQQPQGDADLDVLGEEHDPHVRMAPPQLVRGLDPLLGLRRGHADVDDREIGPVLVDRGEQLLGRRRLGDDLDALVADE